MAKKKPSEIGQKIDLTEFSEHLGFKVWIEVCELKPLKIDKSYQREQTDLVKFIGEKFQPLAFICMLVAVRSDGRYLVDAQQRRAGALSAEFVGGPALCFASQGKNMEAQLFKLLNYFRKAVTVMDLHRAALVAGDETALAIDRIVRETGFRIAIKKSMAGTWPNIGAIDQLQMIYRQGGEVLLHNTLVTINNYWPNQCEALRKEALRGTFVFLNKFGDTLDEKRFAERLKGVPFSTIFNEARTLMAKVKNDGGRTNMFSSVYGIIRKYYGKKAPKDPWPNGHPTNLDYDAEN